MDTCGWALGKMTEMFPAELPDNASDIRRLFIENSDLSASSLRTIWSRLRIFWSWAEKEGICTNVMEGVPAPVMRRKLPRILRRDEVCRLPGSVEVGAADTGASCRSRTRMKGLILCKKITPNRCRTRPTLAGA